MAQLVDFEEVVADAVSILGYVEDAELAKNFCRQWVWEGLKKLSISQDEIEVVKVDVKNFLIKKPKYMRKFEDIALYDSADNHIQHVFHSGKKRIYPNIEAISYTENEDTDEEVTYYTPVDVSESRDSFVIGTNGSQVAYALIRFYSLPLDANGLPIIREYETDALSLFCRWRWSMRKNENQSEINSNKIAWYEAKDWTIAHKKVNESSNEQKKQMAALRSRPLPNFNRSRF
jgi:hypothetical protein